MSLEDHSKPRHSEPQQAAGSASSAPWWRFGMMWLVVGGPLVVVVASLATAVVAYRGADVVLTETASARDVPTARPNAETPARPARDDTATAAER